MTTKICNKCGQEYDISHFSWSIKGIKRHAKCLKCRSEERIAYYQEHREEESAYKYERQKEGMRLEYSFSIIYAVILVLIVGKLIPSF